MLARSFVLELGLLLVACDTSHKPEADPARITTVAKAMDANTPGIGVGRPCTPEELIGGATMTQLTMLKLAQANVNAGPEREEWINPQELDSPAALELINDDVDETTKRQAAFELLSAPFYLVYRIDLVDCPMCLKIKELKRGTVGLHVIRYNRKGELECTNNVTVQNSKPKSDWAIVKSNLALMDPQISADLRADMKAEMLKQIAALGRKEQVKPPEHVIMPSGSGD